MRKVGFSFIRFVFVRSSFVAVAVAAFLMSAMSLSAFTQSSSSQPTTPLSAATQSTTTNPGSNPPTASSTYSDDDEKYPPVKIVKGPVVENVTDATAIIAWSTNVSSGTLLRYGPNPDNLVLTASMPWGGFTHRVYLKGLTPGTTYYFQAESGQAQGTGTTATAETKSFQTK